MSEKRMKKVIVFDGPIRLKANNLANVLHFVQEKYDKIPKEYQRKATWSMVFDETGCQNVLITYKRFETDNEFKNRLVLVEKGNEKRQAERIKKAKAFASAYPDLLEMKPEYQK